MAPTTTLADPLQTTQLKARLYFHRKFDMPCGLLLQVPMLWLTGLPGPPEDSLRVPCEGELVTPGTTFAGADRPSIWFVDFASFRLSVIKLPTTTCKQHCSSLSVP